MSRVVAVHTQEYYRIMHELSLIRDKALESNDFELFSNSLSRMVEIDLNSIPFYTVRVDILKEK